MSRIEKILNRIDSGMDQSIERLFDLLRIKSISTDPAFDVDCKKAAEWLQLELAEIGFDSSVRETGGHPMVVGHYKGVDENSGHALFYGHYDVQPVDPLELWHDDPFSPRIEERDNVKVISARGAADDKGQLMTLLEATRAWVGETGGLPFNLSVLLEGEEESGSPSMIPFLDANREELSCDFALVCDTGMWNAETPAITIMLRGLMGEEVEITAANRDLHSGHYGGAARNPIHVLCGILSQLHDENGRVTLEGFYDGVSEIPENVARMWKTLGFTDEGFLGPIGLENGAGETDHSTLEQIWARPTLEINGISGGYAGAGFKTVIPSKASAKISCRLVGKQEPEKIRTELQKFVKQRLPKDCTVEFHRHGNGPGIWTDFKRDEFGCVKQALTDEWGVETVLIGCGGSIPIVNEFKHRLDMDTILVGFGLEDDQIHSPNEKYNYSSFHKGIRSWARILEELSKSKKQ